MNFNCFEAQQIISVTCMGLLLAATGCSQQLDDRSLPSPDAVPYATSKEFTELVSGAEMPVLVEFSVPTGCYRCQQMRSQVEQVTQDKEGRVDVCRLDFNYERELVAQLGIKMCPTYLVFKEGKEVFRVAYPTSGDMLAVKLDEITSTP